MELISSIIGRSQVAVASIVGVPDKIEILAQHKYPLSVKCYYLRVGIEIIFIEQVADWISIKRKDTHIIPDFIEFMGLGDIKGYYKHAYFPRYGTYLTYKEIEGIKEINIFITTKNQVDFVFIKVFSL